MPADIDVYAEGLSIESDQIKISSGELTAKIFFNSFAMDRWKGVLVIPRMEAYRYEVQNMSVKLSGSIHNLSFNDLNADVYKGKVSGRLNVDWIKDVHYRTDIKFEGVDISALKEVDASVYGQIEGIIQGSVVIGGSAHNFDTLGLKAQITKDGRMNASLLKFVLPYMPRTEGSTNVFGLMKQGLKVPVEVANIEIHSVDEHKISGTVKLGVGQLNLDLNLPVDILYDGNLFSLIEWYKKLGK